MKDYTQAMQKLRKLNYQSFNEQDGEETADFKTHHARQTQMIGTDSACAGDAATIQIAIETVGEGNFWAFICDRLEVAELGLEG